MKGLVVLSLLIGAQCACDGDDQAAINKFAAGHGDGSFPKVVSDCGKSALGWSGINEDSFNTCLVGKSGAKKACTDCFYIGAKYGFANCKWDCLTSWCSSKCLSCAEPSTKDVVACAGFTAPQPDNCDLSHTLLREEFVKFVNEYGREYHGEEYARRFEIFSENYAYVQQENARKLSYRLAINEFSDMSRDEFAATHFGMIAPNPAKMWGTPYLGRHTWNGEKLADSVDWVTGGAVTGVKNQGQCGSCWTFSSTGALEGAFKVAGGALVEMSEQQLVDCCKLGGCAGCSGGLMDYAFQYLRNHHVCTEASYGYTARNGNCHDSSCTAAIATGGVTGYKDVAKEDENALMSACAQQPVAIAIEADQSSFQGYSGGVLTKNCGSRLDHGVLLVGYGKDGSTDYWKVKNSWGSRWGESGYIRLERGIGGAGQCGLLESASYPHVDNKPGPPGPSPSPSPSANCGDSKLQFCCNFGTPCDCSKGSGESGQCSWYAYDYCCKVGTACNCHANSITV